MKFKIESYLVLFVALFGVAFGQTVPVHTNHYPNTSNGVYWAASLAFTPPEYRTTIAAWSKARFDLIMAGAQTDTGVNSANSYVATYTDIAVATNQHVYELEASMLSHGYVFEDAILHSDADMLWYGLGTALNSDKFDMYDPFGQNGVLTCVSGTCDGTGSGTFTDVTPQSYDTTKGGPTTVTTMLYIGSQVPFDRMTFTVTTPSTKTVAFNYWNGSAWTVPTNHFVDGTAGLSTSGTVTFYVPSDWARRTLNTSPTTLSKYWIQIPITGGGTSPVFTTVKGDDLATTPLDSATSLVFHITTASWSAGIATYTISETLSGLYVNIPITVSGATNTNYNVPIITGLVLNTTSGLHQINIPMASNPGSWSGGSATISTYYNARGWSATDSNRINTGTLLEYNPTPPAGQSARFRYQARTPNNFNQNYITSNPSKQQGGQYIWGKFVVDDVSSQIVPPYYFSAAHMDDAGRAPRVDLVILPANPGTHFDCNQSPDPQTAYFNDQYANFTQIATDLHAAYGSGFWVGSNSPVPGQFNGQPSLGDWTIIEHYTVPTSDWMSCTFGLTAPGGTGLNCPYDWAAPGSTNPNNVKFYFQSFDRWAYQYAWAPVSTDGASTIWTKWHFEDQGNRTPLAMLALNYMGSNANTGFMYLGSQAGINFYLQTDQVYTNQTPVTLTATVPQDTSVSTDKSFSISSNTDCSGNYLHLGAPGTGQMVAGEFGMIAGTGGENYTWDLQSGGASANLVGFGPFSGNPNQLTFTYLAPWNSLNISFKTPISGTPNAFGIVYEYWNGTAYVPLTVTDGTGGFLHDGTVSFTPPGGWAANVISHGAPNGGAGSSYTGYTVRVTWYDSVFFNTIKSPQWLTMSSVGGTYSANIIYNTYTTGTTAYCIQQQHLAVIPTPSASNVYSWSRWFPAMATDLGPPDSGGLNGGARTTPWKTGGGTDHISGIATCPAVSGDICSDLWRRDFTNAIVLFRPWSHGINGLSIIEDELDTYSIPVSLGGATYYPLSADGTTGAGTTTVQLRGGEAAFMMKSPIGINSRSAISGKFSGTVRK